MASSIPVIIDLKCSIYTTAGCLKLATMVARGLLHGLSVLYPSPFNIDFIHFSIITLHVFLFFLPQEKTDVEGTLFVYTR